MYRISILFAILSLISCSNPEQDQQKLIDAAMSGSTESVDSLLDKSIDPNCRDKCLWTPLMQATLYNHYDIAKSLLDNSALPELADQAGYTPLLIAATHNRTKIMQLLLEHKANINHQDSDAGLTALMIAARAGHLESSKLLLTHQAETELVDKQGMTALQWAHRNNHTAIAELLE